MLTKNLGTGLNLSSSEESVLSVVCLLVCLLVLRLYVSVNNFSVMSGRSHRFLGITSTFWEVNVSCCINDTTRRPE